MFRQVLSVAAFFPFLLGCALPGANAEPPLSPEQRAISPDQRQLVAMTCDRIMGLGHGGVYRSECMDSLARSVAARTQGAVLTAGVNTCRDHGLHEGTAAFATCVLDSSAEERGGSAPAQSLAHDLAASANADSYFNVSNGIRWRREQYSCAQIGLTPGTSPFGHCVASLDASLMPNPF